VELNEPHKFHRKGLKGLGSRLAISLERSKYGIAQADIICLHDYLGLILANGLRLLAEYEHGWPGTEEFPTPESWEAKLIEIAEKLEQASTTDKQIDIMYNEIEWSEEDLKPAGLEDFSDWMNRETRTPAFQEYSRRTEEINASADKNLKEAMEWLAEYWWSLWD